MLGFGRTGTVNDKAECGQHLPVAITVEFSGNRN
jgi:hypothetical protein